MMLALLGRSFARARGLLVALAAVLVMFQVLVVVAATYVRAQKGFSQFLALLPPMAQQVMGGIFSSFGSMVAFGYFHPVVIMVFVGLAIIVASEPAADVESGVVDLVLARPVRRACVVARSALMLTITTCGIAAMMVTASWLALRWAAPPGAGLPARVLVKLAVNLVAVAWTLGALSLLAASVSRRRGAAAGSVGIVALALYLLTLLADVWPRARPYGPISPFHYFQPLGIVSGLGTRWGTDVLTLAAAGVAFCALAVLAYSRRDL
ncbi:MAG TPA: hypothetical protein VK886_07710 [Vicinamibacterales bacterium]|nr:hypothetical protein [Vicinamibacterales bacterium]